MSAAVAAATPILSRSLHLKLQSLVGVRLSCLSQGALR
jgi:hypothetical protein